MKKIVVVLMLFVMIFAVSSPADAKSKAPKLPNLYNAKVVEAMKNGTIKINGVSLGMKKADIDKKWGKGDATYDIVKRYDAMVGYSDDEMFLSYLKGAKGVKRGDYTLQSISYLPLDYSYSRTEMRKNFGQYDYSYVQGGMKNYIYGSTIFSYIKADKKWELMLISVGDKEAIDQVKTAFPQ